MIQSVMGHADITTTMDIYAEATNEKKQEIMANLQGKIIVKNEKPEEADEDSENPGGKDK